MKKIFVVFSILLATLFIDSCYLFKVAADVGVKVVNADSIINNYEWYYNQYDALKAQEANIRATSKEDSVRAGMIMVYNNNVAEYNAKSRQITRNLWKADDLPYQIDYFKE